jgi:hypothetical protein
MKQRPSSAAPPGHAELQIGYQTLLLFVRVPQRGRCFESTPNDFSSPDDHSVGRLYLAKDRFFAPRLCHCLQASFLRVELSNGLQDVLRRWK